MIATHQLINRAVLNNLVRNVAEENIPDLLHGRESCCDIVFERVILPGDMCHECWNKNTTPRMSIDPVRKISILVPPTAVDRFGFTFRHKSLG